MSLYHVFAAILCGAATASASATTVTINDPATSSGYATSYYVASTPAAPEVHVIGVYETRSDHSGGIHPEGRATIHIVGSASAPVNLVLSSYEPTEWVLDGDTSFIASILVHSYHDSRVTGFDAGKVTEISFSRSAYSLSTFNSSGLAAEVQKVYGVPPASFSGVYRATDFTVTLSAVPEPSSAALVLLGLGAAGVAARRRRGG